MCNYFTTCIVLCCLALPLSIPASANAADKISVRLSHSNGPTDMDPLPRYRHQDETKGGKRPWQRTY